MLPQLYNLHCLITKGVVFTVDGFEREGEGEKSGQHFFYNKTRNKEKNSEIDNV